MLCGCYYSIIKIDFTEFNFETFISFELIQLTIFAGLMNIVIDDLIKENNIIIEKINKENSEKVKKMKQEMMQFVNETNCSQQLYDYLKN